jgi:NADH:ubiquinone oxidoreductase subunit 6 (subunit J)
MVQWIVAGAVVLVILVAAVIVVFRLVVMAADVDMDEDEIDDIDEADLQWRAPVRHLTR